MPFDVTTRFNPTLVRFCPIAGTTPARLACGGFNPTLVRFCHLWYRGPKLQGSGFNPTLVRFCPETEIRRSLSNPCFNPTLVRFCQNGLTYHNRRWLMFQSHLGSILPFIRCGTLLTQLIVSIPPWFDFALARALDIPPRPRGFNPTLVRFCPFSVPVAVASCPSFNPTLVRFCLYILFYIPRQRPSFNPTLVRFCLLIHEAFRSRSSGFNPTLVRFCQR